MIPAYNEEHRLGRALAALSTYLERQPYSSELIIVTDGITDRTNDVAREFSSGFASLELLSFPSRLGKGLAVKKGMLAAHGRYRLFMDADYAVPIEFVEQFLAEAKAGAEIVIGSRRLRESQLLHKQGFIRHNLSALFNILQIAILGLPYKDTQCGFKLFTAGAAEFLFPLVTLDCAYFDAELVYLAHNLGLRVSEVAVTWRHDNDTRIPMSITATVGVLQKLISMKGRNRHTLESLVGNGAMVNRNAPDEALPG